MVEEKKTPEEAIVSTGSQSDDTPSQNDHGVDSLSSEVPWSMKVTAVLLITAM